MNNKGFTLIELLVCIILISLIGVILVLSVSDTFSLSADKSYEIMKKSIISQVDNYISECNNGGLDCSNDFEWSSEGDIEKTFFNLNVLKKYGYFSEKKYINPITLEDISECLVINVIKDQYFNIYIKLDDSNCNK